MTDEALPIELCSLTKTYGSARGILDVDLSVAQGEVFGFIGPNGAGKTTTIRILLDHLRASSGEARVLGLDTRTNAVDIHRRLGFVASDPALYESLTVSELLDWLSSLRASPPLRDVDELAQRLNLDLSRRISELSRGNKQKVSILQAFMHRPELVIMDEPTSGLDPLVQHEFEQLVTDYVAEGGTVFLSSHILSEVEELCERLAIIREGELVALKTMTELKAAATRTLSVEFVDTPDTSALESLPGVEVLERSPNRLVMSVGDGIGGVIGGLSNYRVNDLVCTAPNLEEVFLSYYATGEPK